jgi:hypothetical protein
MLSTSRVSAVWRPRHSTGGQAAFWVGAGLIALAIGAAIVAATREPGLETLVWAAVMVVLAAFGVAISLWGLAYRQLTYTLGEDALEVRWLGATTVVPYAAIDGIYSGQRLVGNTLPMVLTWPGIFVGPGHARGIGRLRFYTTSQDPAALTLITLQQGGVVLSARTPQEFRLALIERLSQEDAVADEARTWYRRPATQAPWTALSDSWLLPTLASAAILFLLSVLALGLGYDALPSDITMRFDGNGLPSQVGPSADLLRVPVFGFLLLLGDLGLGVWVHPAERLLARLLWLAGAVLQGLVLVAVLRLLQQ